jgi:hypothetical protein
MWIVPKLLVYSNSGNGHAATAMIDAYFTLIMLGLLERAIKPAMEDEWSPHTLLLPKVPAQSCSLKRGWQAIDT